jgi:predicted HTH domain antitoxin
VKVSFPEDILSLAKINKEDMPKEIRKMVAFEMYRAGKISLGRACELGGLSRIEFFEENKDLKIPLNYDENDLKDDLATLKRL